MNLTAQKLRSLIKQKKKKALLNEKIYSNLITDNQNWINYIIFTFISIFTTLFVFSIKGLGRVIIQGILNRDYPVVHGAVLLISAFFVFANLMVDLLYAIIDPRVRYE